MRRTRHIPRSENQVPAVPFSNAEEAWLWFARCQRVRREGARLPSSSGRLGRPCDPDDVYLAAIGLHRRGAISRCHLQVLASYGIQDRPPDPRVREELRDYQRWEEALDRLTTALRRKGIVG